VATTPWSALINILQRLPPRADSRLERWALGVFLASGRMGTRVRNPGHSRRRPPGMTPP
jgi:hypothetical protein